VSEPHPEKKHQGMATIYENVQGKNEEINEEKCAGWEKKCQQNQLKANYSCCS